METVKINCRCKDCIHSSQDGRILYCYYWDYEAGMSPNKVEELDFCSNGVLKK